MRAKALEHGPHVPFHETPFSRKQRPLLCTNLQQDPLSSSFRSQCLLNIQLSGYSDSLHHSFPFHAANLWVFLLLPKTLSHRVLPLTSKFAYFPPLVGDMNVYCVPTDLSSCYIQMRERESMRRQVCAPSLLPCAGNWAGFPPQMSCNHGQWGKKKPFDISYIILTLLPMLSHCHCGHPDQNTVIFAFCINVLGTGKGEGIAKLTDSQNHDEQVLGKDFSLGQMTNMLLSLSSSGSQKQWAAIS